MKEDVLRGYPKEWIQYPSVTEVMPKSEFFCSPEYLEQARIEGSRNHKRIERYLDKKSQATIPYLKTFQRFLDENEVTLGKPIMWETPLLSKKWLFKGKPDLVMEKGIVDVKRTFWSAKTHALQLAGYNTLTHENKILIKTKKRFILVIPRDFQNEYRLYNVYNEQADNIFLLLLQNMKNQKIIDKYLAGE